MSNKLSKIFFIVAVFLLLPNFTFAVPSISGVSGTLTHNDTVIVNGSEFGEKTNTAPQFWDTVDNVSAYAELSDDAVIPTGNSYLWNDNSFTRNNVHYSTLDEKRNALSNAQYKGIITGGYGATLDHPNIPNPTGLIYFSWWFKPQGVLSHEFKYLRLGDTSQDEQMNTFTWAPDGNYIFIEPNSGACYATQWYSTSPIPDVWQHLEVYFDSVGRNYTVWRNGVAINTYNWASGGCEEVSFNDVWKVGADGGINGTTFWMDDLYLDTTASRVEICNASTKAGSNHCEIQIPQTTWIDNQLQIKVNQGSFTDSSSAYLYVLDASGTANVSGYPITFGSGSSDTTAPDAPSGLSVL